MPNIKPVSDLRNYNEVLSDISEDNPVYLTKNGRGKYAIVDLHDYEKSKATIKLLAQLAKGEKAGQEQGWMAIEEVEAALGIFDV